MEYLNRRVHRHEKAPHRRSFYGEKIKSSPSIFRIISFGDITITVTPRFYHGFIIYGQKQIEIQQYEKSKFALFCLFFGVLVWKRAQNFLLCVAYFLSVIWNAPRGWMKTPLAEWPPLAPKQTGTIYPFYRFYDYRIVLFYGYFFGPLTSGPLSRISVRLYSVPALHSVSLLKFFFYFLKSFFSDGISFALLILFSSFGFVSNIPQTHTTMLNANSTIFCFRVLGLLSSFGFISNIPHIHHDAQRAPHNFLFPSFGFVFEFSVCFEHSTHTHHDPHRPPFFTSEFWVCCRFAGEKYFVDTTIQLLQG